MSKYDDLRKALGVTPSGSGGSKYDEMRMDFGLMPDTRPKITKDAEDQSRFEDRKRLPSFDASQSPVMKQAAQYAASNPQPAQDASRQLPIIGQILRGLDSFAHSPVVSSFDYAAGKSMGVPDDMMTAPTSTGNKYADAAINFAGSTAGFLTNPTMPVGSAPTGPMSNFFENPKIGQIAQSAGNKAQSWLPDAGLAVSRDGTQIVDSMLGRTLNSGVKNTVQGTLGGVAYAPFNTLISGGDVQDMPRNMLEQGLMGGAMGGVFGSLSPVVGDALRGLSQRKAGDVLSSIYDQAAQGRNEKLMSGGVNRPMDEVVNRANFINRNMYGDNLALPPAAKFDDALSRSQGTVLPRGEQPIAGQGETKTFALPPSNFTAAPRMKIVTGNDVLNSVLNKIKPEVEQRITPPTRRDLLVNYIQDHLQVPREEIHNMPLTDLQELGQMVRQNISVYDVAAQTAAKHGYDLPSMLEGRTPNVQSKVTTDAQKRMYGIYPDTLPNVKKPEAFRTSVTGQAAAPMNQKFVVNRQSPKVEVQAPKRNFAPVESAQVEKPVVQRVAQETVQHVEKPPAIPNERGFTQTVRQSDVTPTGLSDALKEPQTYSQRSTKKLFDDAQAFIEKNGIEHAYDFVMGAKVVKDKHNAVAQILAKKFANSGDVSKAIDIVSKTAKSGTELGRAIQSLTLWNRMDTEGAMLLAQRQLNKGNTGEYRSLTPEQAKPVIAAAEQIQKVEKAKSLADEVLSIVSNKSEGQKLTPEELSKIQEFQKQVTDINGKVKKFLPEEKAVKNKRIIEEVSKVPPAERTRGQLIDYWEARAQKAKEKLLKQRNVGIIANTNNPVLLLAEYGVSKIAAKYYKFADFSDAMVADLGHSIKGNMKEVYNKAIDLYRKDQGLPTMTDLERVVSKAVRDSKMDEDAALNLKNWAKEIAFYADDNLRIEATQSLQMALKEIGTSTLGEKIAAVHTSGMLLNSGTFERNLLGNVSQIVQEKANKLATVPVDWALSKLTGEERTIYFKTMNQAKFWKDFWTGTKSGWKGVSPSGTLDSYGVHPNVFGDKNPLKYLTKALGASLQGFDYAFYNQAKGELLATYAEQFGKMQGLSKAKIKERMPELIKSLDDRIHELADHAGRYATYQDETVLSKGAELLKRGLNEASTGIISRKLVDMGMSKKLSLEGFGAGDIVTKFAKTPANLIMRGIDYSPIGFIRGIVELAPLVYNRSKFNQYAASRAIGRAITGSIGFTGLGYVLADAGILTGSSSMDKDTRSIQEQSGQGAYKVNFSALGRFLMSGFHGYGWFNYDAAKYQKGDNMMDYAWLQPAAISLAMGVNANKAVKDRKDGADASGWMLAGKALLGSVASILENPMVQGVSNIIDATSDIVKKQDATKLANIGKGVPASFVPSVINQFRTATDNKQRETFSKSLLTEMGNMIKNKIPGWSQTLPVSYDSLGNAREKIQGGEANTVGQYLTAFFSPAKMTEYQVSPEAKLVLDLMDQSGDQNVLPRIENRYIKVAQGKNMKDLRVDLTAEQYSQLQRNVGQLVASKLSAKANFLSNPNISLESKVNTVKTILSDAGKKARDDIGTQIGYKKQNVR